MVDLVVVGHEDHPGTEKLVLPDHLSYSQVSTYIDCGERYRLERGHHIQGSTWYASIGGSVVHQLTEAMDRLSFFGYDYYPKNYNEASKLFRPLFHRLIASSKEAGEEIKASGRVTKELTLSGSPTKKGIEWWDHYGPHFLLSWTRFVESNPEWEIAVMPDGTPGIEVPFEAELLSPEGESVTVRGCIDRVFLHPELGLSILDLKTGNRPSGSLQLATYKVGLMMEHGLEASSACFWFPYPGTKDEELENSSGHLSPIVDLTQWDKERTVNMYVSASRGIQNNIFLPHVSNMCAGCGVRDYCWAVQGKNSKSIPVVSEVGREGAHEAR